MGPPWEGAPMLLSPTSSSAVAKNLVGKMTPGTPLIPGAFQRDREIGARAAAHGAPGPADRETVPAALAAFAQGGQQLLDAGTGVAEQHRRVVVVDQRV